MSDDSEINTLKSEIRDLKESIEIKTGENKRVIKEIESKEKKLSAINDGTYKPMVEVSKELDYLFDQMVKNDFDIHELEGEIDKPEYGDDEKGKILSELMANISEKQLKMDDYDKETAEGLMNLTHLIIILRSFQEKVDQTSGNLVVEVAINDDIIQAQDNVIKAVDDSRSAKNRLRDGEMALFKQALCDLRKLKDPTWECVDEEDEHAHFRATEVEEKIGEEKQMVLESTASPIFTAEGKMGPVLKAWQSTDTYKMVIGVLIGILIGLCTVCLYPAAKCAKQLVVSASTPNFWRRFDPRRFFVKKSTK